MKPNYGRYEGVRQVPEVGDVIYIPSQRSLSHGVDDVRGGRAAVTAVEELLCAGKATLFIRTPVEPDTLTSWAYLEEQQAELAARFGDSEAHPDPDERPQFNDAAGDWPVGD